jgi:hypothetical protein
MLVSWGQEGFVGVWGEGGGAGDGEFELKVPRNLAKGREGSYQVWGSTLECAFGGPRY